MQLMEQRCRKKEFRKAVTKTRDKKEQQDNRHYN